MRNSEERGNEVKIVGDLLKMMGGGGGNLQWTNIPPGGSSNAQ